MSLRLTQTRAVTEILQHAVENVPGWTPLDQLLALFDIALASSCLHGDIVEIGSWCGRSTVALGLAAQLVGCTRVHCVDLFPERGDWRQNADGSYSMKIDLDGVAIGAYETQTVWKEPFERDIAPLYAKHGGILEVFRDTVRSYDFDDVVLCYRATSEIIARKADEGLHCRMAFIDGDHGYDAVRRDISNVEQCLVPGGWICFDDAFTSYDGVNCAIREAVIDSQTFDLKQQLTRKLFAARKRTPL